MTDFALITPLMSYEPQKTFVVPIMGLPEDNQPLNERLVDAALLSARRRNRVITGKHFIVVIRGEVWLAVKKSKDIVRYFKIQTEFDNATENG